MTTGSSTYFDLRGGSLKPRGSSTYIDTRGVSIRPRGSSTFFDIRGTPLPALVGIASSNILFGQVVATNVKQESLVDSVAFGDGSQTNVIQASVSSSVAFATVATSNVIQDSAANGVLFGQVIVAGKEAQVSAENNVAFASTPTSNVTQEPAANSVLFGQAIVLVVEIQISVQEMFALDSVATSNFKIISVANSIAFSDLLQVEQPASASNSFGFLQLTLSNVTVVNVQSNIGLSDVVATQATLSILIIQQLSLTQIMGPTIEESVSNSVGFNAQTFRAGDPENDVTFGQVVTAVASIGSNNNILFGQIIVAQLELVPSLASGVTFGQALVGYIERNCDLQEYTPFGIAPVVILSSRQDVVLVCSASSITLRNPTFGNSEDLDVVRTLNISRGGTPRLFRDTLWPDTTEQSISFNVLTRAKAQELLDFFQSCLGLLVTYTDYEDRDWEGIILNPESAIIDEGFCKYSAEILLAGNPV